MRKSALFGFGLVVASLVALGFVVLFSASLDNGARLFNDPYIFVKRQSQFFAIGLVAAVVAAFVDYRLWVRKWPLTAVAAVVVLALLVYVFHFKAINGSRRWVDFGFARLQPSELAKIMSVIIAAVCVEYASFRIDKLCRGLIIAFAAIGILAAPVVIEPDIGASCVIVGIAGFVLFLAGARILHLTLAGVASLALIAIFMLSIPNRRNRLMAFFESTRGDSVVASAEPGSSAPRQKKERNEAYQQRQSLIALKNGGLWGRGLNESMQKHYYLPEAHTDCIFAVGAEELGLSFSLGVLVLFVAFYALAVYIALHAADRFGRLVALGLSTLIFVQALVNMSVVCKLIPSKGMALPFFSYGGTNIVCALFSIGTIFSIGIRALPSRRHAATVHRVRCR